MIATTPEALISDAVLAIDQLEKQRRERCAEYNERIRKLRGAVTALLSRRVESEGELFDIGTVISPDIKALIQSPDRGL